MTENGMVEWHHQLHGHEFEQALGVGEGMIGKPGVLQSMGAGLALSWRETRGQFQQQPHGFPLTLRAVYPDSYPPTVGNKSLDFCVLFLFWGFSLGISLLTSSPLLLL